MCCLLLCVTCRSWFDVWRFGVCCLLLFVGLLFVGWCLSLVLCVCCVVGFLSVGCCLSLFVVVCCLLLFVVCCLSLCVIVCCFLSLFIVCGMWFVVRRLVCVAVS